MTLTTQRILNRVSLYIFLVSILAAWAPQQSHAIELIVRGEPLPESDMLMLPPLCQLILKNPGIQGQVNQEKNPRIFERPEYYMIKGNIHIHHYCYSLVEKIRYFRTQDEGRRKFYFSEFMSNIDYVLQNSPKNWPFFHVMLLEQANMLMLIGDYPHSLKKIDEALRLSPDYEKAYALKSDLYVTMGDKKSAIKAAQEGLEKNPESKLLRRRLERLDVKVPPPPERNPDEKVEGSGAATAAHELEGIPQINEDKRTLDQADSITEPKTQEPDQKAAAPDNGSRRDNTSVAKPEALDRGSSDGSTGTEKKRYCRFCPN